MIERPESLNKKIKEIIEKLKTKIPDEKDGKLIRSMFPAYTRKEVEHIQDLLISYKKAEGCYRCENPTKLQKRLIELQSDINRYWQRKDPYWNGERARLQDSFWEFDGGNQGELADLIPDTYWPGNTMPNCKIGSITINPFKTDYSDFITTLQLSKYGLPLDRLKDKEKELFGIEIFDTEEGRELESELEWKFKDRTMTMQEYIKFTELVTHAFYLSQNNKDPSTRGTATLVDMLLNPTKLYSSPQ